MSKLGFLLAALVGGTTALSDLIYMGTYSGLIASYNSTLQPVGQTSAGQAPSWLVRAPSGDILYAVDEFASGGVVRSFRVSSDGSLEPINSISNVGEAPCHLEVHPSGEYLLASNYCGGSVVVIPVSSDGMLSVPTDTVYHPGNPSGCGGAHTHHAIFNPTGEFALVADLGNDLVFGYSFDSSAGTLTEISRLQFSRGAGPRHIALHTSADYAYIINELDSTITAATHQGGVLSAFQTQSTLRTGETVSGMACAEVVVAASGQYVYGSNRDLTSQGRDSIVVYAVDEVTGALNPIQHVWTGGQHPRHFELSASQDLLLVANKDGRNVVSFDVNASSGLLTMVSSLGVSFEPTQILFPE